MYRRLTALMIGLLMGATLGACSSEPDVPDEPATAHKYRSTDDEQTDKADQAQAQAQPGAPGQQAAAQGGEVPQATGPIAHVDGQPVTADRFNEEIDKIVASGQFPPQLLGQVKQQLIEKIVDKYLIDRAVAKADVEVAASDVEQRIEEIKAEFARANERTGGQMGSLDQLVDQLGITKEEFRESVRQSLQIEKLLAKRGMAYPTDAEVQTFYEENKERFEQPAQIHARHILVKVAPDAPQAEQEKAKAKIDEIYEAATAEGADFEQLAKERSEGPSAPRGGDLGYFAEGQMVPEFETKAKELEPGEISEPVKTQFGWHVIQKVDAKQARTVPLEELSDEIKAQMKNQRIQAGLEELLQDLRDKAKIELHPENVS